MKIAVAALLGVLLLGGVAGAHQLRFAQAKRTVKHFTAEVCNQLEGCNGWRVGPCTRRSPHRIDCVSRVFSRQDGVCRWMTIAVLPRNAYNIQIHHKRIIC